MKIETWLPIFPGFYGTLFDGPAEEAIEQYLEYLGVDYPSNVACYVDLQPDWRAFFKEYAERITEAVNDALPKWMSIEMQQLVSPREYNFANDSIDIIVEAPETELRELIATVVAHEDFAEWIYARYTSRSGFISSYSNDVEDWKHIEDLNGHYLGTYLEFYLRFIEDFDDEALYYKVESPCVNFEIEPTDEQISSANELLSYVTIGDRQARSCCKHQADIWHNTNRPELFKEAAKILEEVK